MPIFTDNYFTIKSSDFSIDIQWTNKYMDESDSSIGI